jgi:hypothetical protein
VLVDDYRRARHLRRPARDNDNGTIDDDAHLFACNEFLARINAAETRGTGRPPTP